MSKHTFGKTIPGVELDKLRGALIVIEGGDGAGRSTQSLLLIEWLEKLGYPTIEFGLKNSDLVGAQIEDAMEGNTLCPITLSLFYATDFAVQLERTIIPSLQAGFVVVADRYIYTPMVRAIARGVDERWIRAVYNIALVPDLVVFLDVPPAELAERNLRSGSLDYWESGMDISTSGDMYKCFIAYQIRVQRHFQELAKRHDFTWLQGSGDPLKIQAELQKVVKNVLPPI